MYNLPTLQALATSLTNAGVGPYTAYLVEGHDARGIDVGFLVKSTVVGSNVMQYDPAGSCSDTAGKLFDRPPLAIDIAGTLGGNPTSFTIIVNHFRSKGSDPSGNCQNLQAAFVRDTAATLESSGVSSYDPAPPMDAARQELLARYVRAFESYDLSALTALIQEDARQSMPPYALWLSGREDILAWWFGPGITCRDSQVIPVMSANGSPAFGHYRPRVDEDGYEPWSLQVLEIEDGRIVELTFFLDTATIFPLFGLPLVFEELGQTESA